MVRSVSKKWIENSVYFAEARNKLWVKVERWSQLDFIAQKRIHFLSMLNAMCSDDGEKTDLY